MAFTTDDDKIADLYSKLEEASKNSGTGNGDGINKDDLKKLMKDKLKKYAKKKSFEKFKDHTEKEIHDINKWEPVWKQMEKDIADLKKLMDSKVSINLFEDELDKLKNAIN